MNLNTLHRARVAVLLGVVLLAGCSSNNPKAEAPAVSAQPAPPIVEHEPGESADIVTPAETVTGIWTQIAGEQGKLTAAIQSGRLADVHHSAFAIRDLVVALAPKAKAASPASADQLDGMVELVKASATRLDELGDAGDASGTQAEYAKLEALLNSMGTVTGGR